MSGMWDVTRTAMTEHCQKDKLFLWKSHYVLKHVVMEDLHMLDCK